MGQHRELVPELRAATRKEPLLYRSGRASEAEEAHQAALDFARQIGDPMGELNALGGLGFILEIDGDREAAIAHHRTALELARRIHDQSVEIGALSAIADLHRLQGQPEVARRHWRRALDILAVLDVAKVEELDANEVRARLERA